MKNTKYIKISTVLFLLICSTVCRAADPLHDFEDFSGGDTAGWTNDNPAKVVLSNSDEKLNAAHLSQSFPAFVEDCVKMPFDPAVRITQVSFRIAAVNIRPSRVRLQFHAAGSDNTWSLPLALPEAGEQIVVDENISYSDMWTTGSDSSQTQFDADVQNVDWVGVEIRRNGDPAEQNYTIDDFLVCGLVYIIDSDGDKIADSWEAEHGLSSSDAADALLDSDGDGVSNYAEYRAGTDPNDSGSMFKTEIQKKLLSNTQKHFELHWKAVPNRSYTILRSSDLRSGFYKLTGGIPSTPPENVYIDAVGSNAPAFFYKIEIEPEL